MTKLGFSPIELYPDVDMLKRKALMSFAAESIQPRRPRRSLPPLPEEKECTNIDLRRCTKVVQRKRRLKRAKLPSLPESDENWEFSVCFFWKFNSDSHHHNKRDWSLWLLWNNLQSPQVSEVKCVANEDWGFDFQCNEKKFLQDGCKQLSAIQKKCMSWEMKSEKDIPIT